MHPRAGSIFGKWTSCLVLSWVFGAPLGVVLAADQVRVCQLKPNQFPVDAMFERNSESGGSRAGHIRRAGREKVIYLSKIFSSAVGADCADVRSHAFEVSGLLISASFADAGGSVRLTVGDALVEGPLSVADQPIPSAGTVTFDAESPVLLRLNASQVNDGRDWQIHLEGMAKLHDLVLVLKERTQTVSYEQLIINPELALIKKLSDSPSSQLSNLRNYVNNYTGTFNIAEAAYLLRDIPTNVSWGITSGGWNPLIKEIRDRGIGKWDSDSDQDWRSMEVAIAYAILKKTQVGGGPIPDWKGLREKIRALANNPVHLTGGKHALKSEFLADIETLLLELLYEVMLPPN
ncbi:MAG: hypothetical protein AB7P04_07360 [Bacteriovoracia bacterium]